MKSTSMSSSPQCCPALIDPGQQTFHTLLTCLTYLSQVNNQMVSGTLMNLCDSPNRVSVFQVWRDSDLVQRVPIIVTGNDFSTLFAPLIRDGRMAKFYWEPDRADLLGILHQMYKVGAVLIREGVY